MRLQGYRVGWLFGRHGIPVPRGDVAVTPEQARRLAQYLGFAVAGGELAV